MAMVKAKPHTGNTSSSHNSVQSHISCKAAKVKKTLQAGAKAVVRPLKHL
ncbi:hypothetical protein SCP_0600780 [Sparassis crispa]|uniref:Uncharacterized protein n=1 Tax=Sparassis crispa TaxID=139825 RepID=A0A401GPL0_9APHY|nr:hypothetical protein SCP_0600780 [Sparassis crispa]GBE84100.1 hypothetical protein SCP_0600780 [Sparassis crispa]